MTEAGRALFEVWPRLAGRVPLTHLGDFPTPIESLAPALRAAGVRGEAWVKRDDLSSPVYGGNKVRTLEVLFADAVRRGARVIYSTGAYGSNHATATVLHAPRAGLEGGALLFPQPCSECARENLEVILSYSRHVRSLPHWSALPLGMWATERAHDRSGERAEVMPPGGATPLGAMGYVSAGLELARQVADNACPAPRRIVVGVGSTCTSAGLLVGLWHAARLGVGFGAGAPIVRAVRVTPWPVTSPVRILRLAVRASRWLAEAAGDSGLAIPYEALRGLLEVDGKELGRGYGHPTEAGRGAIRAFEAVPGLALDTTYTGKSGASLLRAAAAGDGPVLYWATKSTAPLPPVRPEAVAAAPWGMRRWLARGE